MTAESASPLALALMVLALMSGCGAAEKQGAADGPREGGPPRAASNSRAADLPAPGGSGKAPGQPPRLILLISIDTLRADHLGFYGSERNTSPGLDLLAREGVVFDDASATSSWTLPSHTSMLTGLTPQTHGLVGHGPPLSSDVKTVAAILSARGYTTAAVTNSIYVKKSGYGLTREFDVTLYVEDHHDRMSPSTWITDQAIQWIRDAGESPLFVFLHYYDVHSDFSSLPKYEKLFVEPYEGQVDGSTDSLSVANIKPEYVQKCRVSGYDEKICRVSKDIFIDENTQVAPFDEPDLEHLRQLYDAGIRQIDDELGRLFRFLRERELLDETLLIVTSDHGEEFQEHGGIGHGRNQYQESIRVPLMMRGPGIPAGRRVAEPVSLIDIVPTLAEITGARLPRSVEGLSLVQLYAEGARELTASSFQERFLFMEAPAHVRPWPIPEMFDIVVVRAVRHGRYKLHYDFTGGRHELYDLTNDPGETMDLTARQPEVFARLVAVMEERHEARGRAKVKGVPALSRDEREKLRRLGYFE